MGITIFRLFIIFGALPSLLNAAVSDRCLSGYAQALSGLPANAARVDPPVVRDMIKQRVYFKHGTNLNYQHAWKQTFLTLAEICKAMGSNATVDGIKGYVMMSGLIIDPDFLGNTERNFRKFKEAFIDSSGTIQELKLTEVMEELADSTKFSQHPVSGAFTSNASGARYEVRPGGPYPEEGGEGDTISHILRQHTENNFTAGWNAAHANTVGLRKSLFVDPKLIFKHIDDALKPNAIRHSVPAISGNLSFYVDLNPVIVGLDQSSIPTTRILISIRQGTTNVIHTAYPY